MKIRVINVIQHDGDCVARAKVVAPDIGTEIWMKIRFPMPTNFDSAAVWEEAYDRVLAVLDPA